MKFEISNIQKPCVDDSPLLNVLYGLAGAQALFVAHNMNLFKLLSKKPLSIVEICEEYNIAPRAAQAMLSMLVSQNFIGLTKEKRYTLTDISKDYLLEESPTYFGSILDRGWQLSEVYSFESFKKALMTNRAQVYGGEDLFETNEKKAEFAKGFTKSMHCKSMGPASAWPSIVDLTDNICMLDVGGGSGAHSIGAVLSWPRLQAIVYDRAVVCDVAKEFINKFRLQDKIRTYAGDMWQDNFPEADLHFYSDIFHDWTPKQCTFLTEKSFESLKPGGRIIIHEMLFDDDKTGPYPVAAYNIFMLLWAKGQQFSAKELNELLRTVGFIDIKAQKTGFGDWSIITGRKPA
ncbi:MAG: methyltransferase [Candidatus Electrothrix sp. GW3-4]|uniref:methyltransferase n=1 Tax=Candidatus Electrothrix sp. GW3-4 TaxID=3126740 RepID=UPI0030D194B5